VGTIHGGDRLPWVEPNAGGDAIGNFAPLASLTWQVHVYGEPAADIRSACEQRRLPLQTFPWTTATARAGFGRDAVYLVRPDGYVALAAPAGNANAITSYLDAHTLTP
jgi:hypothetical protein